VLCQYRPREGGELGGWGKAVRAIACTAIDSEGVHERLLFLDRDDRPCWQLHLLPDTDFLAWDRLCAGLPHREGRHEGGIALRLWQRFADRERWRLDALRLHALPAAPGFASLPVLAASRAPLSLLGAEAARRIARSEGIDAGRLVDDGCCRRSAMPAVAPGHQHNPEAPYSLIRFGLTRST
jgi:hypothetical protein